MYKCIKCNRELNFEDEDEYSGVIKRWYSCECGHSMISSTSIEWFNEKGESI